jgi:hypothetical protein
VPVAWIQGVRFAMQIRRSTRLGASERHPRDEDLRHDFPLVVGVAVRMCGTGRERDQVDMRIQEIGCSWGCTVMVHSPAAASVRRREAPVRKRGPSKDPLTGQPIARLEPGDCADDHVFRSRRPSPRHRLLCGLWRSHGIVRPCSHRTAFRIRGVERDSWITPPRRLGSKLCTADLWLQSP